MPLPLPDLHDKNFQTLLDEMISVIPAYNKEWSNYNYSDPGITLLELFAWLADQTLYRINRVPLSNYEKFLKLMGITLAPGESLKSGILRARALLFDRYRAIIAADYETLLLEKMEELAVGLGGRLIVMEGYDFTLIPPDGSATVDTVSLDDMKRPGYVSVVVIPRCDGGAATYCDPLYLPARYPTDALLTELDTFIQTRRLIATTVVLVKPSYATVQIVVDLGIEKNADKVTLEQEAKDNIEAFFDPVTGGPDGTGWPMGRSFYRSELFQLLESVSGVDHVVRIQIQAEGKGVLNEASLHPWKLVYVEQVTVNTITV